MKIECPTTPCLQKKLDQKIILELCNLGPEVEKLREILIHTPPKMPFLRPKIGLFHGVTPVSHGNTTKNVYNEF